MVSRFLLGGLAAGGLLVAGFTVQGLLASGPARYPQARTFACQVVSVHDGDTFRCSNGTRVRLNGINARELDGSCGTGHPCPRASAEDAHGVLEQLALGRRLQCQRVGTSYDRVTAWCADERGRDVSCSMISSGTVARWARYDPRGVLLGC